MASCRRGDEERNVLEEVRRREDAEDSNGWRKARNEGARILEAMVKKGVGEEEFPMAWYDVYWWK